MILRGDVTNEMPTVDGGSTFRIPRDWQAPEGRSRLQTFRERARYRFHKRCCSSEELIFVDCMKPARLPCGKGRTFFYRVIFACSECESPFHLPIGDRKVPFVETLQES